MDAVRQLPPSEKLELNEMIWREGTSIPMEHQSLVNTRIEGSTNHPELLQDCQCQKKDSSLL